MKKFFAFLKWLFSLFSGRKPAPPITPGKTVVSAQHMTGEDGSEEILIRYSDGSTELKPYDKNDPTGVNTFLDSLP